MSLNELQLTPAQVAELYASSLVLTTDQQELSPKYASPSREASLIQEPETIVQPIPASPPSAPPAESTEIPLPQPPKPIQFLGKNSRHFVVLVDYPDTVHISDSAFEFLSSVLKACQLNAADIAIVNLAQQKPGLEQIIRELQPRVLLNFAAHLPVAGLQASSEELAPQQVSGMGYMSSPHLDHLAQPIEAVKPLKRRLWEGLKTLLHL